MFQLNGCGSQQNVFILKSLPVISQFGWGYMLCVPSLDLSGNENYTYKTWLWLEGRHLRLEMMHVLQNQNHCLIFPVHSAWFKGFWFTKDFATMQADYFAIVFTVHLIYFYFILFFFSTFFLFFPRFCFTSGRCCTPFIHSQGTWTDRLCARVRAPSSV